MTIKKITASICLALMSATIMAGSAVEPYRLLLSGPVESVDSATNTVNVLGHRLVLRDASAILPGHILNVFGGLASNGALKAAFVHDTAKYAASGDKVLVVGAVTALDRTRGTLYLSGAAVDYTPLLSNSRFVSPEVGDVLEITGTQPAGRNLILAGRISRSQGVNAGGQAVGVNAGGQAVGVNAGGQAVGVNAGGQAVGVNLVGTTAF